MGSQTHPHLLKDSRAGDLTGSLYEDGIGELTQSVSQASTRTLQTSCCMHPLRSGDEEEQGEDRDLSKEAHRKGDAEDQDGILRIRMLRVRER